MLLIHIKIQNKNSYKHKLHLALFCFYTDSNTFACRGRFHTINIFLVFLFQSWHLFICQKPYKNIFIVKVNKQNSVCNLWIDLTLSELRTTLNIQNDDVCMSQ